MRVLVTGNLGVLGTPLTDELRDRGYEVWGCDRMHSGQDFFVRADVGDYRQLSRVFEACKPDVVWHLAAEFGRHNGEQYYEDLWQTGAIGTRNVMELCRTYGSKLLFASSSEVYGETDDPILSEGIPANEPMWLPNEYAISKLTNEMQIESFRQRYGLDVTRFRFFNAYGPGEAYHPFRSVVCLFCHKALRGETLPVYQGYHRTFMYIDDFIPTLANAVEAKLTQPVYNIGGADYRSVEDLARIVLVEVKGSYFHTNGNGLGVSGHSDIDLIPEDKHNVRSKRPDITFARNDLGHDPQITLEDGVPETVEWMRLIAEADTSLAKS